MENNQDNKFDSNDNEEKQDKAVKESKKAIKEDAKGLWISIKKFTKELLDFRDDTDTDATIATIKSGIPFKGATTWILICSIFVASIGLNANSTAVVIGAMLISPLMGPILGVGFSIAINDVDTLRRSMINLVTMIILSLGTAFLFFKFFPLSEDTSELLGRVKPDIRDVLIAFFGGLALIIAMTKKGTIASVIFGVAIATALMPPLCTAGYGLAKGNFPYFFGAMYLFAINTIFIALATFLVVKILGFPMLKYANSTRRKRISRVATAVAIIAMIPAIFTFRDVWKQSKFEIGAQAFINNEVGGLPHFEFIKKNALYKYSEGKDQPSIIELNSFGLDEIHDNTIAVLEERLKAYPALSKTKLIFNRNRSRNLDNMRYLSQLRYRDSLDLLTQTERITYLEDKVNTLSRYEALHIPFEDLTKELKINYENVERISYATVITSNFEKMDTIVEFTVKWNPRSTNEATINKDQDKLKRWLKQKYSLDTLLIRRER